MAVTRQQVVELYVATFNRAPDADGLDYWVNLSGLTIEEIAQSFFDQAETQTLYPEGTTDTAFVTSIYTNLFNRAPDAEGLAYWEGELASGNMTRSVMIEAMKNGALGADAILVANKATVGLYYADAGLQGTDFSLASVTAYQSTVTAAIAEVDNIVAYGNTGTTFTLTKSVETITGTDANDTINANYDVQATAAHTLGALDVLDGGAGTDTLAITSQGGPAFTLAGATISNIETMTIRADLAVTANTSGANVTGLNTLSVAQAGGDVAITAAATTDVNVSGLVNADAAGANAVADIAVTGGKTVSITHAGVNGTAEDGITVNGAVDVNVTLTNSLAEDAGIVLGAVTANTGAINVQQSGNGNITAGAGAGGALDTIAVTGGTTITVNQDVTAINNIATAGVAGDVVTQGAVNVTGTSATTTVTVTQDDQVAAVAAVAAVAGVNQTQTVTFSAMTTGQSVTVNGLTFTAAKNLTAAEVAAAFSNLTDSVTANDLQSANGPTANGIYTNANSTLNYSSGAANGAVVTYTATVQAANTAALTVVASVGATAPVAALAVSGAAATTGVTGVAGVANGAVTIADGGTASITDITVDGYAVSTINANALTSLTLKNSGAGTMTVTTASVGAMTLNLDDVDAAVSLDAGGASITSLTVNTSGTASTGAITAAAATTVTINAEAALSGASAFTAATLIDVNGSAAVNLTGATTNAATLQTIDASGNTGGVTAVLGATNAVKFTGGTGADSLTLATAGVALGDDVDMGAGNDTLTIGVGTTAANILSATALTGGEGTDTLAMSDADAVAVSASIAFAAKISGFERLTINNQAEDASGTATTQTVNLANLGFNYVTVSGTNDGVDDADTLALTGVAANTTIAFADTDANTDLYTVTLTDATGTADVVNYVLASTGLSIATNVSDATLGTAIVAGTVTANGVETFNISSTAVDVDGATNTITTTGNAVTTINISGNAGVTLTAANATLTTVDASGLTAGALTFTVANASSTITGGAGNDVITVNGTADSSTINGGAGNDTFAIAASADLLNITGGTGTDTFDFNGVSTNKSNYVVINGVDSGDTIDLAGLGLTSFNATQITLALGATESTQAYLDQAMTTLAANGAGWFQYNGNTYVAGDVGADSANSFADGTDFVTMIVGLVDLSAASFNATASTLEIA